MQAPARHAVSFNPADWMLLLFGATAVDLNADNKQAVRYGPDLDDTVVIWQTTPRYCQPRPGANRRIIVAQSGGRAWLEPAT
ncbi:MAG: hypothetical protein ABIQ52_16580 [Vicinamibacterales bacterium]